MPQGISEITQVRQMGEVNPMPKLEYHAFRKPKKLKSGKTVHRWYYYYVDASGKKIQKSCGTDVKSRQAA